MATLLGDIIGDTWRHYLVILLVIHGDTTW